MEVRGLRPEREREVWRGAKITTSKGGEGGNVRLLAKNEAPREHLETGFDGEEYIEK